ncbi:MAG: hypothetical protein ACRD8W_31355, partial [Nitrososphaeraceae archaeon]
MNKKQGTNLIKLLSNFFYMEEIQNLDKDPTFNLLHDKRNIRIHRGDTPVRGEFSRRVLDKVTVHDSVSGTVIRKNGNIEELSTDRQQNRQECKNPTRQESESLQKDHKPTDDEVKWYFTDYDKTFQ